MTIINIILLICKDTEKKKEIVPINYGNRFNKLIRFTVSARMCDKTILSNMIFRQQETNERTKKKCASLDNVRLLIEFSLLNFQPVSIRWCITWFVTCYACACSIYTSTFCVQQHTRRKKKLRITIIFCAYIKCIERVRIMKYFCLRHRCHLR